MILHLGVKDIPCAWDPGEEPFKKRKRLKKALEKKAGKGAASMIGDVATILEKKYGVMEHFWDKHQTEIVAALQESIEGAFKSAINGATPQVNVSMAAASEIEHLFAQFLSQREMDGMATGVPTAASLRGVSHRFKHPYAQRASRPSFIDTGLFETSFTAWIE